MVRYTAFSDNGVTAMLPDVRQLPTERQGTTEIYVVWVFCDKTNGALRRLARAALSGLTFVCNVDVITEEWHGGNYRLLSVESTQPYCAEIIRERLAAGLGCSVNAIMLMVAQCIPMVTDIWRKKKES